MEKANLNHICIIRSVLTLEKYDQNLEFATYGQIDLMTKALKNGREKALLLWS